MTFYLMAISVGAIGGGITAYLGHPLETQCIIAGIVTILAACLSFYLRRTLKKRSDKVNNQLDLGNRVAVYPQNIKADGTALVKYRGTDWTAFAENAMLQAGIYHIVRIDGPSLVLGNRIEHSENNLEDLDPASVPKQDVPSSAPLSASEQYPTAENEHYTVQNTNYAQGEVPEANSAHQANKAPPATNTVDTAETSKAERSDYAFDANQVTASTTAASNQDKKAK